MKFKGTVLTALVAALALASGLRASSTIAGAFATENTGTRPLGMGGAFAAVADDANATFSNPAGMAFFDKNTRLATFAHTNLFSLSFLTRDFVAYAQGDEGSYGALGLSWNHFNVNFSPEQYSEDTFMYSGAKLLTGDQDFPQYAVGWNLKYLRVTSDFSESSDNTTVGGGNATGYGADLGVMIKPRESLSLALVARDLYSSINWDSGTLEILPTTGVAGMAYQFTKDTLFAADGDFQQTSGGFNPVAWHLGAEHWFFDGKHLQWGLFRNFGARAGYQQILANNDGGQVSVGASAQAQNWQLDYAYQFSMSSTSLGGTHRFGLSFSF